MPYICTGYDAMNYFRSENLQQKNLSKMQPQTASDGISRERFMRGSPNFTRLSGITGTTNLLDMTSLVTSGRLQNAIKHWTKVMRKTGGQRVKIVYSRTRHEVTSYFQSAFIEVWKTAENATSDGFGSNFSGAPFCLPHQLVASYSWFNVEDS